MLRGSTFSPGSEHCFCKKISTSDKLEIPSTFMSHMGGALAKRCILRDGEQNEWHVEVAKHGDKWWFCNGWDKLCREKSLNEGDILIFEYKGNKVFHFKLFGEGARDSRVKEEEEKHEELEHSEDDDDDDDDDDDYMIDEEDDDYDGECVPRDERVHISKKIKPGLQLSTTTIGATTIPSKRRYKKHNVPDCYGAEIFKSGLASRPDNPYFVSRTRTHGRKNELCIPKNVIVDYHLNIPEKLLIVDERGRKWETKMKQWKDGRVWCTKGWGSLCRVNKIERDDTCICEFVRDNDNDMFLHVRVVSRDN